MNDKNPKPMDEAARERAVPEPIVTAPRNCRALNQFVAEVNGLFPPSLPVETTQVNGRGIGLGATIDLTVLDEDDRGTFVALLSVFDLDADPRIESVEVEDDIALVVMHNNSRTQDDRSPFGLAEAWAVLNGDEA